jgi:dynactin-5
MSRKPPRGEYIETVSLFSSFAYGSSSILELTRSIQDTGNKVARKANLVGTQNIMLGGKTVIQPEAMIRGDLTRLNPPSSTSSSGAAAPGSNTAVSIGRYCFLDRGCCLRPPSRMYKGCVCPTYPFPSTY